jgi:hypothetical protein
MMLLLRWLKHSCSLLWPLLLLGWLKHSCSLLWLLLLVVVLKALGLPPLPLLLGALMLLVVVPGGLLLVLVPVSLLVLVLSSVFSSKLSLSFLRPFVLSDLTVLPLN